METICAWCKDTLSSTDSKTPLPETPVSHGICPSCVRNVLSSEGLPLEKYLDQFAKPVFLVDAQGNVITANSKAIAMLGKNLNEVKGQAGGDAFGCQYASLPGGCGKTLHCKSCTIRNTVTDTLRTGKPHKNVPAYPELHHVTGENRVRFLISTEKVADSVFLQIESVTEISLAEYNDLCNNNN